DDVIKAVTDTLEQRANYDVEVVRLINLLHSIPTWRDLGSIKHIDERYDKNIKAGDKFRDEIGSGDALAVLAILDIMQRRAKATGSQSTPRERCAYIFRSLKRPEEIETLRSIYGPAFVLIGVYAPKDDRRNHLAQQIAHSHSDNQTSNWNAAADHLIGRDEQE